jgi:hypothetical protein
MVESAFTGDRRFGVRREDESITSQIGAQHKKSFLFLILSSGI